MQQLLRILSGVNCSCTGSLPSRPAHASKINKRLGIWLTWSPQGWGKVSKQGVLRWMAFFFANYSGFLSYISSPWGRIIRPWFCWTWCLPLASVMRVIYVQSLTSARLPCSPFCHNGVTGKVQRKKNIFQVGKIPLQNIAGISLKSIFTLYPLLPHTQEQKCFPHFHKV